MTLYSDFSGTGSDGRATRRFCLSGAGGIEVGLTDYGATLVSLRVPDRFGALSDVVIGYDSLEEYERQTFYCGGIVGRYANRIARGQFILNGNPHQLSLNNGAHHLHGGVRGFNHRLWRAVEVTKDAVTFEIVSPDGEEGYPATLTVRATYSLAAPHTLRIELSASSDAPTIVNLTSHSYFNLAGHGTVLDHLLTIPAATYTPVDDALIPTGERHSVAETPFDFQTATPIGARLFNSHPQLRYGNGYDHNFVIKEAHSTALVLAARLADPASGRVMTLYSTQPGIQVYSGNFLAGEPGRAGSRLPRYGALALEAQNFPDAPNHPAFPSPLVTPDQPYHQVIEYRFTIG